MVCALDTAAVTELSPLDSHFFLVPLCRYAVSERQMLLFFARGVVGVDSQARNQDFMWGGANEAKVDQTTEMYFLLSDPFI